MCVCLCVYAHTCMLSHVRLFVTPWTLAREAPLFLEFSRQEYWKGLPFPPPEDLPDARIKPRSPALAGGFFTTGLPGQRDSPAENRRVWGMRHKKFQYSESSVSLKFSRSNQRGDETTVDSDHQGISHPETCHAQQQGLCLRDTKVT